MNCSDFYNIPTEMRVFPNFVLWKYEEKNGAQTKVPYQTNGRLASVSKPLSWTTFDECVAALPHTPADGIGFVITKETNLVCIDIDDPFKIKPDGTPKFENPNELLQKQIEISNSFDTFQEISPSGKGLHIWVKGSVPSGRDRHSIGLYPVGRFMTMTGRVFKAAPINDLSDQLFSLWEYLGPKEALPSENVTPDPSPEPDREIISDEDVLRIASGAVNGSKFSDLWAGNWHPHYASQSEADYGLIDMLAFYTDSKFQVLRMFRNSALGQRKKALRAGYTASMIDKSFDRKLPPVNLDALREQFKQQLELIEEQADSLREIPPPIILEGGKTWEISLPVGLVGELAKYIYESAPRPVKEIGLVGALGLMAGICGRCYNVLGTGLNQYLLLLAKTGTGKESMASGIDKLIHNVRQTVPDATGFIGPSEISSPQALIKYLANESNSFVSVIGEFTAPLKKMTNLYADPNQIGLKKVYLDLYGKSGKGSSTKPIIYSDKDKNTAIVSSPGFSIIGESNPEEFYSMLSHNIITDGLLPRFTIIEYKGHRPKLNKEHSQVKPPEYLIQYLSALCAHSCQLNNTNTCVDVKCDEEAEKLTDAFNELCDNEHRKAPNEATRDLWSRGYLKALKMAALLAVGYNYINPVITKDQAEWAIGLCELEIRSLLAKFEEGEVGTPQVQIDQVKDLKKAIRKYVTEPWEKVKSSPGASEITHKFHCIPHGYITCRCAQRLSFRTDRNGHINAINTILNSLIASGDIQEISVAEKTEKGFASRGKIYAVVNVKEFCKI